MPLHNADLEKELDCITQPDERKHMRGLFEASDPIMHDIAYNLIVGNHHEVDRLTRQALAHGYAANTVLDHGLIAGMAIVGMKFRDSLIFVPEVLVAARAMKAGMVHIEPVLAKSGMPPRGTVVMGTVQGDLHDIGKNLCTMLLRGAGFVVRDLGVDIKPEEFIEAIMKHEAQILGMSALLTTTMPQMGKTIEAIEAAGLRDAVKIMVGGAPLTQEFADDMGADGFGENAIMCVELAKHLLRNEDVSEAESVPSSSDA
jgi:5-methyltetrahydrofolate--homocysteine methyltransferase